MEAVEDSEAAVEASEAAVEAFLGGTAMVEAAPSALGAAGVSAPAQEAASGSFPRPPPVKRPSDKAGKRMTVGNPGLLSCRSWCK